MENSTKNIEKIPGYDIINIQYKRGKEIQSHKSLIYHKLLQQLMIISTKGCGIMKFIISGKNIDVTAGLKAAVEDKIGKLEKYFTPETEVHATLSVEKERQKIEHRYRYHMQVACYIKNCYLHESYNEAWSVYQEVHLL